jgi:hypothetical protein
MRGKRKVGPGGHATYQVEDPCSVFEKIPGTPKYWQSVKYEMIAKLENIGPFQVLINKFLNMLILFHHLDQMIWSYS